MSKEVVDSRIPNEIGQGVLPSHAGIKTPWEKIISYHEAYYFGCRHMATMAAELFEVIRVFLPDYEERMEVLCRSNHDKMYNVFKSFFGPIHASNNNMHPFMEGAFVSAMYGDSGDERLLMNGRVNDFGTYRAEKELDTCVWDILGSEICRISPCTQQGIGEAYGEPSVEFNMVEAIGCGDLHCRLIAENREKYPLPPREKIWETFGPIATADQIKFTPEDKMLGVMDSQYFRESCGYHCRNGLSREFTHKDGWEGGPVSNFAGDYVTTAFELMKSEGKVTQEQIDVVIECLFEGAGKFQFADGYAKKGLRDWLGVPNDVDDGRVMGAYIEVLLQIALTEYKILAFNKDEVIYDINLTQFQRRSPMLVKAYLAWWYGMSKTLVGSRWACWQITEDVPEDRLRIKIAKKVDKFCR
jgi:hypothetical protein